jgi:exosortase/archaeosortase family protein
LGISRLSFIATVTNRISSRERQRERALPRRDVFIWAAAILFCNHLFGVVKEIPEVSLEALVSDLLAIGIFQYLAWYVVFRLLIASDAAPTAGPSDILVIAALCLPVFLPTSRMVWVAATGVAFYLWLFNQGDPKVRAAGVVLAALAVQELWGHIFFNLVIFPLLRAETAVVGTLLEVMRPGTVWHDNAITGPNGYGIVIINACSSFHNLSLAMLCWLTVSRLRHQDWRARDFVIGGVIGLTMILFNVVRICLMAWNNNLYHYWHDGIGAEMYAIAASLTILLMSLYGSRRGARST